MLESLQQDIDMIIGQKTNAEMFIIETCIFYFLLICFSPLSI